MGSLMSVVNKGDNIKDGKHKTVKRKHTFCNFQHNGDQVCQVTTRHWEAQVEGHQGSLSVQ